MATIKEDAPANSVGGGKIAGVGVGPKGEPGFTKKQQKKLVLMRRKPLVQLKEDVDGIHGHFAGHQTFIVPSHDFLTIRHEKRKGKHWRSYIDVNTEHGQRIRDYANKNYGKPVIVQCKSTGAMCFARYGKK